MAICCVCSLILYFKYANGLPLKTKHIVSHWDFKKSHKLLSSANAFMVLLKQKTEKRFKQVLKLEQLVKRISWTVREFCSLRAVLYRHT